MTKKCTEVGEGIIDGDAKWNSSWKTVSSASDNLWITEIEIPFKDLGSIPQEGDLWRLNLNRSGKLGPAYGLLLLAVFTSQTTLAG